MSRAHVLLVESIHASAQTAFSEAGITVHRTEGGLSESELTARLRDLPGEGPVMLGIRSKTKVTASVLEAVPRLAAVGAFCIGTDQIALDVAQNRGIAVFNAPFSNTRSVAELIIGEIIMLSRQIFPRSMAAHRGSWQKSASGSHEVRGKTLGIIGYGHIGSQLSVLAEALGLRVLFYDVASKLPLGNAQVRESLDELLAESDFVSLHVPDTAATRKMVTAGVLAKMKKGAYLLNASRGQVVDIDALKAALDSGHVAGAAIDVYPQEPAKVGDDFESALRGLDQVILSPHIGGSTQEAQENIGREVSQSLAAFESVGTTAGNLTLPALDLGALACTAGSRIVNVHRNVPGVLSKVNAVIAGSGLNICAQQLSTRGDVGLLAIDLEVASSDERVHALHRAIADLDASIRSRIVV